MSDLVRQNHGKIVNEIYMPLYPRGRLQPDDPGDQEDITRRDLLDRGRDAAPSTFYQAYRAAGFDPTRQPIASLTTSEAEVAEMAAETAEGHITAAPFFETLASPAARRFVTAYKERYGADAPIRRGAEAAYFQVHLAMRAIAQAAAPTPNTCCRSYARSSSRRRRGACGSTARTTTPISGLGSRASTHGRNFQIVWDPGRVRASRPLLRGAEPLRLVVRRNRGCGRPAPTRFRRRADPDPARSAWPAGPGDPPTGSGGCRTGRPSPPHRLSGGGVLADPRRWPTAPM